MKTVIKLNKDLATPIGTKEVTTTTYDADGSPVETVEIVQLYDWVPAFIAAATELAALNAYVGHPAFPDYKYPIPCDPNAVVWVADTEDPEIGEWVGDVRNFLGDVNTPPSDDGMVEVAIADYVFLASDLFPAMPTTFFLVLDRPPQAGSII